MKRRKVWKRIISISLSIVLTLTLFLMPAPNGKTRAVGSDDGYDTKIIYQWQLVGYDSQLPAMNEELHCLLCWARNGVAYCAGDTISDEIITGRELSGDPYLDGLFISDGKDAYFQVWEDTFRTTTTKGSWTVKTIGKDSNNGGIPKVELHTAKGDLLHNEWSGLLSDGLRLSKAYPSNTRDYQFSVATYDAPPGAKDLCDGDAVKFFLYAPGLTDPFLEVTDGGIMSDCSSDVSDWGGPQNLFRLYVCREVPVAAIKKTYTVKSGNTFQLKSDAYLDDGVSLIIEPGAVVTLDGKFYNNGKIENYGTLILHEGAAMCYHDAQTANGSSITNYGSGTTYTDQNGVKMQGEGNLIVMKDAKLLLQNADNSKGAYTGPVLSFKEGSTFVNYGFVSSPFSTVFSGCHIQMKEGSTFVSGTNYTKKLGTLDEITQADMNSYGALKVPVQGCSFLPSVNYVDSYGTWYNLNDGALNSPNVIQRKK